MLEWFANNYKKFGAALEFITNRSQEGSQFCKGFGGIGGLLRYKVNFDATEVVEDDDDDLDAYFWRRASHAQLRALEQQQQPQPLLPLLPTTTPTTPTTTLHNNNDNDPTEDDYDDHTVDHDDSKIRSCSLVVPGYPLPLPSFVD